MSDGRWSMVDGRWSMSDARWSMTERAAADRKRRRRLDWQPDAVGSARQAGGADLVAQDEREQAGGRAHRQIVPDPPWSRLIARWCR
jgi:hypothetical protein